METPARSEYTSGRVAELIVLGRRYNRVNVVRHLADALEAVAAERDEARRERDEALAVIREALTIRQTASLSSAEMVYAMFRILSRITDKEQAVKVSTFDKVTRVTVVPGNRAARGYEGWGLFDGCEVHLQDDGRTLKIFPRITDKEQN